MLKLSFKIYLRELVAKKGSKLWERFEEMVAHGVENTEGRVESLSEAQCVKRTVSCREVRVKLCMERAVESNLVGTTEAREILQEYLSEVLDMRFVKLKSQTGSDTQEKDEMTQVVAEGSVESATAVLVEQVEDGPILQASIDLASSTIVTDDPACSAGKALVDFLSRSKVYIELLHKSEMEGGGTKLDVLAHSELDTLILLQSLHRESVLLESSVQSAQVQARIDIEVQASESLQHVGSKYHVFHLRPIIFTKRRVPTLLYATMQQLAEETESTKERIDQAVPGMSQDRVSLSCGDFEIAANLRASISTRDGNDLDYVVSSDGLLILTQEAVSRLSLCSLHPNMAITIVHQYPQPDENTRRGVFQINSIPVHHCQLTDLPSATNIVQLENVVGSASIDTNCSSCSEMKKETVVVSEKPCASVESIDLSIYRGLSARRLLHLAKECILVGRSARANNIFQYVYWRDTKGTNLWRPEYTPSNFLCFLLSCYDVPNRLELLVALVEQSNEYSLLHSLALLECGEEIAGAFKLRHFLGSTLHNNSMLKCILTTFLSYLEGTLSINPANSTKGEQAQAYVALTLGLNGLGLFRLAQASYELGKSFVPDIVVDELFECQLLVRSRRNFEAFLMLETFAAMREEPKPHGIGSLEPSILFTTTRKCYSSADNNTMTEVLENLIGSEENIWNAFDVHVLYVEVANKLDEHEKVLVASKRLLAALADKEEASFFTRRVQYLRANSILALKNYKWGLKFCQAIADWNQDAYSSWELYFLALALFHLGALDKAGQRIKVAINLDFHNDRYWALLGEIEEAIGNVDLTSLSNQFAASSAIL